MLALIALPAVLGGLSATVSSSDLASSPGFGNLKATWDTDLELAGSKAKLSLLYDMKAKKDFVNQAKLTGALADVKYAVTHAISSGVTSATLTTKQAGHVFKAVGDTASQLTQVAAKGSASVGGIDIDYEPAYLVKKGLSKLSLGAGLGGGLSAAGTVSATSASDIDVDYSLAYDTSLGKGRQLSATVTPADQAASIDLVDSITEPGATWVASMDVAVGSKPKLNLMRSMKF